MDPFAPVEQPRRVRRRRELGAAGDRVLASDLAMADPGHGARAAALSHDMGFAAYCHWTSQLFRLPALCEFEVLIAAIERARRAALFGCTSVAGVDQAALRRGPRRAL